MRAAASDSYWLMEISIEFVVRAVIRGIIFVPVSGLLLQVACSLFNRKMAGEKPDHRVPEPSFPRACWITAVGYGFMVATGLAGMILLYLLVDPKNDDDDRRVQGLSTLWVYLSTFFVMGKVIEYMLPTRASRALLLAVLQIVFYIALLVFLQNAKI